MTNIKKITIIILAVILLAFSINMFLAPHQIAAGGITGLAILTEKMFGFNRAIVVLFFNVIIIIITFIFLGKKMFFNTILGALLLPFLMEIMPSIMLISDKLMSAIVGSIFFGIGVSLLYKNNASSGGTSIPPLILEKYFRINTSIGLFVTDSIIVSMSILVFGVESFFYAIMSIIITSAVMKYLDVGIKKRNTLFIISDKSDLLLQELLHHLHHGVTVVPAKGGYSGENKNMLMVTLSSKFYRDVIDMIDEFDKEAFVITFPVSDVHGLGFTYQSASV